MKNTMRMLMCIAVLLAAGPALSGPDMTDPADVLKQTLTRPYQDLTLTVHLVKTSKSGRERPMDLVVKIKDSGDVKKTLAEFTGPDEVKGMKSLMWDYAEPNKETDRWFKLAGLDFVKCLGTACQRMEDQFGFTMDVFAVEIDQADHTLLGEEVINGAPCYKIESKVKDPERFADPRLITWVDKEKFAARKVESYDKDGKVSQTTNFTKFEMIGDHWWETAGDLIKSNGKKVSFEIKDAKLNQGIDDSVFEQPKTFKVEDK